MMQYQIKQELFNWNKLVKRDNPRAERDNPASERNKVSPEHDKPQKRMLFACAKS